MQNTAKTTYLNITGLFCCIQYFTAVMYLDIQGTKTDEHITVKVGLN